MLYIQKFVIECTYNSTQYQFFFFSFTSPLYESTFVLQFVYAFCLAVHGLAKKSNYKINILFNFYAKHSILIVEFFN